jgi:uncharacterized protein (TIGR03437 family)
VSKKTISRVSPCLLQYTALLGCAYAFDGAVHQFNPRADAPPIRRTGNPADENGATCLVCHAGSPVNSGPGRLVIRSARYTPGVKQIVEVDLRDPNASKWGFQLTARLASDPTRQAGSFASNDETRVRCGPAGASYAPCDGEQEFASHSLNATDPGVRGGKTFRVEWTPPSTDVGDVVFFAAGNAANNNVLQTGDLVYSGSHRVSSSACTLTGTPSIAAGGIAGAADLRTVIAPNGLISVFGSLFSPAGHTRAVTANDLVGSRVPAELDCVALEIDGRRSPLSFISSGQINAQVPTAATEGQVAVHVILNPDRPNEVRSNPVNVRLDPHAPGFFTFDGRSIAALNASSGNALLADPAIVPGSVPARPGDVVVLYGTGFGVTEPVYQAGEFSSAPLRDVISVTVGLTTISAADILFAGAAPDAPGLFQFNLRLPASTPEGAVPVSIRIGNASTQPGATIPVRR